MNLKFILFPTRDGAGKVIGAIENLPEGTIEGLSQTDTASAYLERESSYEIIAVRPNPSPSGNRFKVKGIPDFKRITATNEYVLFNFRDTDYKIYF